MDLPASGMLIDLTPTFGKVLAALRMPPLTTRAGAVFIGALGMMV